MKGSLPAEKPVFRVRSRFYPVVVTYAHPIRITGVFLVLLFMLPELARLFAYITGIGGFLSYIFAGFVVALLAFLGPLIMTWLDYKAIIYSFYKDRVEFIHGFWVREKLTIPYRAVTEVLPSTNWAQRKYKIGNVRLVAEPKMAGIKTKQQGHELPDLRNPGKVASHIEKLLEAYKNGLEG